MFPGKNIVNLNRYPEKFISGSTGQRYTVSPQGTLITGVHELIAAPNHKSGAALSYSVWAPCPSEEKTLDRIEKQYPNAVIIGPMSAALAYPGRVFMPIPVPGFEHAPAPHRMMQHGHYAIPQAKQCVCKTCACGS